MASVYGANVTKYDAGGSGDNIIADGIIKTIEKVWIDSYVVSAAIPSTTSVLIARIPKNKKVTSITVHLPTLTGVTSGTAKVYCCTGATTSATTYFGTLVLPTQKSTFDASTACTLRMSTSSLGFGQALAADTGIYITFDPDTATTGGTIKTIVKYT